MTPRFATRSDRIRFLQQPQPPGADIGFEGMGERDRLMLLEVAAGG